MGANFKTGSNGLIAIDKVGNQVLFLDPVSYETVLTLDGFAPRVHELLVAPLPVGLNSAVQVAGTEPTGVSWSLRLSGPYHRPTVCELGPQQTVFENGAGTGPTPPVAIYDSVFINENVFSGGRDRFSNFGTLSSITEHAAPFVRQSPSSRKVGGVALSRSSGGHRLERMMREHAADNGASYRRHRRRPGGA